MPSRLRLVSLASTLVLAFAPLACDGDDDSSGDSTGEHMHEHGAEESTAGDEHGADEHGEHDHSLDTTAGGSPAESYCACVFAACHDAYHAKWGEDEVASREACIAEAEALPMNGSPTESGNFIECREHFCEEAAADESLCPNALGEAVCM